MTDADRTLFARREKMLIDADLLGVVVSGFRTNQLQLHSKGSGAYITTLDGWPGLEEWIEQEQNSREAANTPVLHGGVE